MSFKNDSKMSLINTVQRGGPQCGFYYDVRKIYIIIGNIKIG